MKGGNVDTSTLQKDRKMMMNRQGKRICLKKYQKVNKDSNVMMSLSNDYRY